MVKIDVEYLGGLRCQAKHGPSGAQVVTDAPVDNHGKGESFSPTDLVATALASCMATIMGIYAERKELDLSGLRFEVTKEMSTDMPRRIARLDVVIHVPLPESSAHASALKQAALSCPVKHSLDPAIEVPITWKFLG